MKKLLLTLLCFVTLNVLAQKINTVRLSNGDYMASSQMYTNTNSYYVLPDSTRIPIYRNTAGRFFIFVINKKTSKVSRKYLNV